MSTEELKKKIYTVIETSPLGSFATINEGKPWVRYVMIRVIEGNLYFTAFRHSRKVAQLQADPHCHTILGGDSGDFSRGMCRSQGLRVYLTHRTSRKPSGRSIMPPCSKALMIPIILSFTSSPNSSSTGVTARWSPRCTGPENRPRGAFCSPGQGRQGTPMDQSRPGRGR